jgi:hypothetical protein
LFDEYHQLIVLQTMRFASVLINSEFSGSRGFALGSDGCLGNFQADVLAVFQIMRAGSDKFSIFDFGDFKQLRVWAEGRPEGRVTRRPEAAV